MRPLAVLSLIVIPLIAIASGCNQPSSSGQQAVATTTATQPQPKARPRPRFQTYVANLEGMKSKDTSPEAIQKVISKLSWVKPGSVRVLFDEKTVNFTVKEGATLNEAELKKVVEATGEGKIVTVARESTA
jgi:hypothetical protein